MPNSRSTGDSEENESCIVRVVSSIAFRFSVISRYWTAAGSKVGLLTSAGITPMPAVSTEVEFALRVRLLRRGHFSEKRSVAPRHTVTRPSITAPRLGGFDGIDRHSQTLEL